jgi:hypothetical protein
LQKKFSEILEILELAGVVAGAMERGDDSSFARLSCEDSRNSGRGIIGRALRILANRIESGQRAIRKQYGPSSVAELFGWVVVKFDRSWTDSFLPLY